MTNFGSAIAQPKNNLALHCRRRVIVIVIIFPKRDFLLLLLTGCAATQIINQWSNPNYTAGSFKKIVVIGHWLGKHELEAEN